MQKAIKRKVVKSQRFLEMASLLKKKRVKSGLSQTDLAEMLGYSSSQFISNWERGICSPALNSLPKLSKILSIKETEIIELFLRSTKTELEETFGHSVRKAR